MPIVKKRAAAQRDLIEHFAYLVEKASVQVADRYLVSAETTFHALARQPLMGAPLALSHPSLTGARKWRVKNFDNYLIFTASKWRIDCPCIALSQGLEDIARLRILRRPHP